MVVQTLDAGDRAPGLDPNVGGGPGFPHKPQNEWHSLGCELEDCLGLFILVTEGVAQPEQWI